MDGEGPRMSHLKFPSYPPSSNAGESTDHATSTEEEIVEIENVTVKFRISDVHMIAQVYPNRMILSDIKKDIARKFEIDPDFLILKQCNRELEDECLLLETDSDDFGIHEFSLELYVAKNELTEPGEEELKLDLNVYYQKQRLPDFITVHIPGEDTTDGQPKNVVVEIQNKSIKKPYLCGYKNKATGVEYLDAYTQTGPYFDKRKCRRYYSRDTQTYVYKQTANDTSHDQSTQCFLDGNNILHVSNSSEFVIIPRKYQTYAQKMRLENKLGKICLIQRAWRRYLAEQKRKKEAKEFRRKWRARLEEEEEYQKEFEKSLSRAQRAKQFPCSRADFDLLHSEIYNWKKIEMKRIVEMYDGAARIAEINILLDKEIQLLNNLERQKRIVFKSIADFRAEKLLTELGKPIKWIGYKDHVIHLDLLRNQRARFLNEIYKDLQKPLNKQERIELLQKVKEILVNESNFPHFPELFDLIEREKNLLIYTKCCDVEILHKRQNLLFTELIKFSKDQIVPKKQQQMCVVCKEVKPIEKFAIRTRQDNVETCQKCFYLSTASSENSKYIAILRSIQRDEKKKKCSGSFAFIVQVDDIRHIIEQIWHGHSILSKNNDLSVLRLPRWIKSEDWAPWNCICLTESEMRTHYKIDLPLDTVYNRKILLDIGNRLMLARSAYHKLAGVSVEFVESGEWFKVGMNKQRSAKVTTMYDGKPGWIPAEKCVQKT